MTAPRTSDKPAEEALLVGEEDQGQRLDKWLAGRLEGLTRTRIRSLIEGGALDRAGSAIVDPAYRIRAGDRFRLDAPPPEQPRPKGEALPLAIHYEDEDLIVVDKPPGMVTHPAAGNWSGTLVNALIAHCGESLSGVGGVARPGIVHRLDKDTSGLIVAAKNDRAHQGLAAAFASRDLERVYEALAIGAPRPAAGMIDAPLVRAPDRRRMRVDLARVDARRAVTHYRVVEAYGRNRAKLAGDALASRIECRLETGRTHQIRVHLSHIGSPLIGDPDYGRGPGLAGLRPGDPAADRAGAILRSFRRQALHARVLGFAHPVTGAALRFEAVPPPDFAELAKALSAL
jgi:23S rRNA pseudouridine1911/1915/1917 synthase